MSELHQGNVARARLEAVYGRSGERVAAKFEARREHGRQAIDAAMDTARAKLTAVGEFSAARGGEIAGAGTLTCLNCGRVIYWSNRSHVPTCPNCQSVHFRKTC